MTDERNDHSIHEVFEIQVERTPDAVAVVFGNECVTYRQLDHKANQLARYLQSLGVGADVPVAVCFERSVEMIVALLGVLKAGGAYVPLDPSHPKHHLSLILEDTGTSIVLTQERLLQGRVGRLPGRLVCLDTDWEAIAQESPERPQITVSPGDLAYVMYTSGSTGKPKGVMVPHRGVVRLCRGADYVTLTAEDVFLALAPLSFDASTFEIWGCLLNGGRLVVMPPHQPSLEELGQALRRHGVTTLWLTAGLFHVMVDERLEDLRGLRQLLAGGDVLSVPHVRRAAEALDGCRIINGYGPTENTTFTCCYTIGDLAGVGDSVPIGYPIAGTQVYLLDERLAPVPEGSPGELYAGGAGVARGYLNRPDLTEARFIPSPFSDDPSDMLYRTGDLARRREDGAIEFLGRIDQQVKIRGYRIEPGEVEAVLRRHPAVKEAVVIAREDGPGQKRLVAYVVENLHSETWKDDEPRGLDGEVVSQWQALYEDTYTGDDESRDPAFDTVGWNSSYTGLPIAQEQMREFVDGTVSRILATKPSRVLEIGCGTGLLLLRLAPACTRYTGTDFSRSVLSRLRERLNGGGGAPSLPHVTLDHRSADDFAGIEPASMDTVILNSVSQYFPSIEYFLRVIEGAVAAVAPGGRVFIGDVRSLPLLSAYHASVQLYQAPDALSRKDLAERVRSRTEREEELLVSPELFDAIQARLPQVSGVRILNKRGRHHNEITMFRYDVIIEVGSASNPLSDVTWMDAPEPGLSLTEVRQALGSGAPDTVGFCRLPDQRVAAAMKTVEWLASAGDGSAETAGEHRLALKSQAACGVDPEELWELAAELGYDVHTLRTTPGAPGLIDVVFRRTGAAATRSASARATSEPPRPRRHWRTYGNSPLRGIIVDKVVARLRDFLQQKLPDFMNPSDFVLMDALPLTANGKVDRRALPAPNRSTSALAQSFIAPRTPVEEVLCGIFAEVFGLARVGIHDDFFELGGHSLLAVQIISRVRAALRVDLPLRSLLDEPTVARFAKRVEARTSDESRSKPPSVTIASRGEDLPLSFPQQQMWLLAELEPNAPVYNDPFTLRMPGHVDTSALASSLREIVRRHEAWRTTYELKEGRPVQIIHDDVAFTLSQIDLRSLPEGEREAKARTLATEELRRPFDLAKGPLIRATLMRLGEADHRLYLALHHILYDGVSLYNAFLAELRVLYEAFAAGAVSPLPPLHLQYADFAAWQRRWLRGEGLLRQAEYWRQKLAGVTKLSLPTDRPRPAIGTFRGARHYLSLSKELTEALKALSRRAGTTLFMTLLAAYKALLFRYTGQEDIPVATVVSDHGRPELCSLIGCFVNTLVLRTSVSGSSTFRGLLDQVREVTLGAYANQELPFEELVRELSPERSLGQNPLFQVMFLLDPPVPVMDSGWTMTRMDIDNGTSRCDLSLELDERPEGLVGLLEYSTDLFDADTIARMADHYRILLEGITAAPERKIEQLPILTEVERRNLLAGPIAPPDLAPGPCIHRLFEAHAESSPDAVALRCNGAEITYGELNRRANRLARRLRALGVGPEVFVALCLERSLELVVALLGVLKAGGAYVPLDPAYPPDRLAFMLDDAKVPVLITQEALLGSLPPHGARTLCIDAGWDAAPKGDEENLEGGASAFDAAYVIYTSGSTGRPKGVVVSHANVTRLFSSTRSWFRFDERDVWTLFHSYAFDFSVWEMWGALLHGGRLVIVPFCVSRSPEAFYELLAAEGVTVLNQTPSAFRQLILAEEASCGARELALRLVIFGGEALELQSLRPWFDRHGDSRPALVNMYGITETTVHVTYRPLSLVDLEHPGSVIGAPIPDLSIYLLDGAMQPVPLGVPGEMYVGGAGVSRGYLNRPELTRERFIVDPFRAGTSARLYKTGDLARRRPDGELEYLGRIDHQVKIRGFRIELGEIEAALAQHPSVREVVVIALGDAHGDRNLVAYVVDHRSSSPHAPSSEGTLRRGLPAELRGFLKSHLPDYMVPSSFVLLDAMPLTSNGKVDRRALPAPDRTRSDLDSSFVAPRTPMEAALAALWADALGLLAVGASDNFFELGGHSILATRILSRVRDRFQVSLPLRALFEAPTISEMAKIIEARRGEEAGRAAAPVVPVPRGRSFPLSSAQRRLWFLARLDPSSPVYNEPATLHIKGALDVEALERSLNEIIRRHEAWRTTFGVEGGEPVQIIHPEATVELPVMDLAGLAPDEREAEARRIALRDALRPFDLVVGPMVRGVLVKMSGDEHRLYLTLHHIVADAVSVYSVFLPELSALYSAFSTGRPPTLPALPVQVADHAVWEQQWLRGSGLEAQLAWWKRELGGELPVLELPTDRPRQKVQSSRGSRHLIAISSDLTRALKALGQREGATLFMTLLAAFNILLCRTSGQEDIIVGTVTASRSRPEIENLIGFFLNTIVLRTNLRGDPTFRELLARVADASLNAYSNQEVPFDRLVEELQPSRAPGQNPLFQVAFVLEPLMPTLATGWSVSQLEVDTLTAKFELTLELDERPEGLIGRFEYRSDLFDASTIARMADHFGVLLEGIVADPDRRLSELPIMTEAEIRQQGSWNETRADYSREVCIHHQFEIQAARSPDAIAIVSYSSRSPKATLTYGELNRRANQLAHYLRCRGVGPEVTVAICAERSPELVVGLLGILKAGGACVPLDPSFPKERTAFTLDDVSARVVLTQRHLAGALREHAANVVCLDEGWAEFESHRVEDPPGDTAPDALAYIIYTSGSTGRPKGVELAHRGLISFVTWYRRTFALSGSDRGTQIAGPAFDVSIGDIWPILAAGASLHIPDDHTRIAPSALRDWIVASSITVAFLPTPLAESVLPLEWPAGGALRAMVTAGDRLHDYPSPSLPFAFINAYGPTESTVYTTTALVPSKERVDDLPAPPIGRPIDNTRVFLLDSRRRPVPVGVPGELYIGGDGLARGYHNRPDLTAERFIESPPWIEPRGRLYKTGDLARYLPDGSIEFLGRADFQVKIRGFRVELGEIESILRQHRAVKEAVVTVREDTPREKRLVAYLVLADGEDDDAPRRLKDHLKEYLPEHMIPVTFVRMSALPINPSGKIDRRALPPPEPAEPRAAADDAAPATELERLVASIWRDVLHLDEVGLHANFFDLGGHSLRLAQVHDRLASSLGRDIPMVDLFTYPTVSALSRHLAQISCEAHYFTKLRERVMQQKAAARRLRRPLRKEAKDHE
ncbi:amino acid adenylation domain-containing protein [Sorangium sp. So ce1000]|uniref:amino acid adenylation domain-containing protein n=1 Tax=Sorangium sp. So ce1000 TaxID=3133325 RepID=UPI003F5E1710